MAREVNPFTIAGELDPERMIDRDEEAARLLALAEGGHSSRLAAPRRYGKTTLLGRALTDAEREGMAVALVDLEGVLSTAGVVIRIERAYSRSLKGPVRRAVDSFFRSWNLGLSLGAGGFAAAIQRNPTLDAESVLLRLLELPERVLERAGARCLVAFDEFQDILAVDGADGAIRSVIQHHAHAASYTFAGSAPSLMSKLFEDPSRPLLEHALIVPLAPLPLDAVADYVEARFRESRRDPGGALSPLVDFARGHPQRSMLLAHHLWELTPRGSTADEDAWVQAREEALEAATPVLAARWRSLPANEQRVALALATSDRSLYDRETYVPLGLKRGSIRSALAGLVGRAEVLESAQGPELADPLLELWLQETRPL